MKHWFLSGKEYKEKRYISWAMNIVWSGLIQSTIILKNTTNSQ